MDQARRSALRQAQGSNDATASYWKRFSAKVARSTYRRYATAVIGTVLATAVRMALAPLLHNRSAFFAYILAVLFTAWYGGLGPALLAIVLGMLTASYFFLPPVHSFSILDPEARIKAGLFVIIGLTTALLSKSPTRSRKTAEESARRARDEIDERMRAEAALKRTIEEVRLLVEAGQLLGSTLDPGSDLREPEPLVARVMDCDGLLVSSFSEAEALIRCAYAWVEGKQVDVSVFPTHSVFARTDGMQSTVLRTRQPLRVPDVEEREKLNSITYHVESNGTVRDQPGKENRTYSLMIVPILLEGQVLGLVQVSGLRKMPIQRTMCGGSGAD